MEPLKCSFCFEEILVKAKNRYEAEEIAKDLYLEDLKGSEAVQLIIDTLEVEEVEEV